MSIVGTLKLPDEEITIHVTGEYIAYQVGPVEAYNKAKETIITAEEERRDKIIKSLEDKS